MRLDSDTLCIPGLPGEKAYDTQDGIIDFEQGFFMGNPLLHPEIPYHSRGMSAVSTPYALWHDDVFVGGVLLCFFLLIYAFNRIRTQLRQQTKDFFSQPKERTGLFAEETSIESQSRMILILQICLLGALGMFAYTHFMWNYSADVLSVARLLALYVACFAVFFATKRILSGFINWIFFPKYQQKLWHDSCSFLISVESISFFPLLLLTVFLRIPPEKSLLIFLFILLTIKIILSFKTYQIFFPKSYCLFHLFAYLCALEFMPLLALWSALAMITGNSVVKY